MRLTPIDVLQAKFHFSFPASWWANGFSRGLRGVRPHRAWTDGIPTDSHAFT